MKNPQIDAVIFDIGNVLLQWDAHAAYKPLGLSDEEIKAFFKQVGFFEWNLEQDRGRTFADGIEELSSRFPDERHLIAHYDTHWQLSILGPIQGTVDILTSLATQKVPLHAITNFSAEKFPLERARFDFFGHFGEIVVSGEEKLIKPDPEIYELLLSRTGLKAERTFFIDDSMPNVKGAMAVGMHAHHFTAPSDLREALRGFELPGGANV
ncbi:MAG: HAD family phosphatase [Pseudomonadota bacterium]